MAAAADHRPEEVSLPVGRDNGKSDGKAARAGATARRPGRRTDGQAEEGQENASNDCDASRGSGLLAWRNLAAKGRSSRTCGMDSHNDGIWFGGRDEWGNVWTDVYGQLSGYR